MGNIVQNKRLTIDGLHRVGHFKQPIAQKLACYIFENRRKLERSGPGIFVCVGRGLFLNLLFIFIVLRDVEQIFCIEIARHVGERERLKEMLSLQFKEQD